MTHVGQLTRGECLRLTAHSHVDGTSFCRCGAISYSDDLTDADACNYSAGFGRRCIKVVNHNGPHKFRRVK